MVLYIIATHFHLIVVLLNVANIKLVENNEYTVRISVGVNIYNTSAPILMHVVKNSFRRIFLSVGLSSLFLMLLAWHYRKNTHKSD